MDKIERIRREIGLGLFAVIHCSDMGGYMLRIEDKEGVACNDIDYTNTGYADMAKDLNNMISKVKLFKGLVDALENDANYPKPGTSDWD